MNLKQKRTALLLVNLGTPDTPTLNSVGRYLVQFLNDKQVITLPWLFRILLVNLFIIPFRLKNSTRLYRQLWTPEGSPLAVYTAQLKEKLQKKLQPGITVFAAMRYQHPSLQSALAEIRDDGFERLLVLPLYPQFAASTTISTIDEVNRLIRKWIVKPEVQFISSFYNHPGFLDTFNARILSYKPETYDFILFSFHGLPNSHIARAHAEKTIDNCLCETDIPGHGEFCYRAACYHTARLLAERLSLTPECYGISFQSRLSKNWLSPFTDQTLIELAQKGHKHVLVVAPAFVADCLETIVEIGIEYKQLFIAHGGEQLTLVESLNADDSWAEGIHKIVSDFMR
ncbi:MAG: ferrochelatase [Massilibacteroides sp.]|nr:ferrochelatase [Massilibacteroides sp.]MDD3061637.1 ferrochelatase [Massilibacteroides sp.]MDD4114900.1 ferrochelatase [Massilibacteroides sp.]MDD4659979.1 ferrochelatase [Massilibacteroides sp.]